MGSIHPALQPRAGPAAAEHMPRAGYLKELVMRVGNFHLLVASLNPVQFSNETRKKLAQLVSPKGKLQSYLKGWQAHVNKFPVSCAL